MKDEDFLNAMGIRPEAIPEPTPSPFGQAQVAAWCDGDLVHMTRGDLDRLIQANRELFADGQAFAREASVAQGKASAAAKEARVWRGAFLLLAIGVASVTVWGVLR